MNSYKRAYEPNIIIKKFNKLRHIVYYKKNQ